MKIDKLVLLCISSNERIIFLFFQRRNDGEKLQVAEDQELLEIDRRNRFTSRITGLSTKSTNTTVIKHVRRSYKNVPVTTKLSEYA